MKIKWNEKYTSIAIYTFLVISGTIVFYLIASQMDGFKLHLSSMISVFNPFIIGFVMAYLFNFILVYAEKKLKKHTQFFQTHPKKRRALGLVITYLVVSLFLFLFVKFIFPQLIDSLIGLVNDIPTYIKQISLKAEQLFSKIDLTPEFNQMIDDKWQEFIGYIVQFMTNLIPKIGNFGKSLLSSIWNIVLGLIISIYLLIDKEEFNALVTKVNYGLLPHKTADTLVSLVQRADHIFGRFLSGKLLDSFIVGILMFVVLILFKMPYAILISFIVGLTNIIPFFGPFIGAIPSFFIILFESVPMALSFLVIVFVIQQIDGNIIGPKILGDSLGISPFWILFSLLVAGKLLGFIGLVVGVPFFVFIYSIIKDVIEKRLIDKGLPHETEDYLKKD
ncbi:MAG TPA: AI-2E family transporter [Erysipelothrix sp.]|nr:AI-2E family transporter [Erysipelothrix sp.]